MRKRPSRPSPALIVAIVALVAAMTGAAVALPGKNSVKSNDIAENAVKSKHIKKKNVKGSDLANDAVNDGKVEDESLSEDDIGDYDMFSVRTEATSGVDLATARAAAPEVELATFSELTIYGKCLRDTTAGVVAGEMYVETSADGAIMEGDDDLPGNNDALLNTDTLETDRQLDDQTVGRSRQRTPGRSARPRAS